jgi:uncharacterized protein
MKSRFVTIFTILLLIAPISCDEKPKTLLPTTAMQIGSGNFVLEKAINLHDQEVGLMHRDTLDPGYGMIFICQKDQPQTFWNHDTHFDLDLVFVDSKSRIVDFKKLKAYDETNISSSAPAQYVIELSSGTVMRVGVKIGDTLTLPGDVLDAAHHPPN